MVPSCTTLLEQKDKQNNCLELIMRTKEPQRYIDPKREDEEDQCDQKKSPNVYKSCLKMISLEKT